MRVFVASLFVPVALFAVAAPALASSPTPSDRTGAGKSALNTAADQNIHNGYWTASSEYYVAPQGYTTASASGRPLRHILITGYHPVKGFESEVAKETAAVASR